MTSAKSLITLSDEVSSEVATEILTKQQEHNLDPQELLRVVQTVHATLRELSERAHKLRYQKHEGKCT